MPSEEILCIICNDPVTLQTSPADENGKAIHAGCYLERIVTEGHPPAPLEPDIER